MLFRSDVLERIASGEVTLAFRRWHKPPPADGSTLRTPIGVLVLERVQVVRERDVSEDDAKRAGAESRAALLASLPEDGALLRIELRLGGEDPRAVLRRTPLAEAELPALLERLAAMDRRARSPWTRHTLSLIAAHPGRVASQLAKQLSLDTALFKRRVRQLKELGLTESLEVGYRLSERGEALARALGASDASGPAQ
jgi:hypothetical protein